MEADRTRAVAKYRDVIDAAKRRGQLAPALRILGLNDLYFLLVYVLNRHDMATGTERRCEWLYQRCLEVQEDPDGYLDLWAREHYKSTIITFGKTIQDILSDPEITIGIFSFNRPMAKQFVIQIKREFEFNLKLRRLFADILWQDPEKQAPKWSENEGIIVKRQGNPKEATVEAWGVVDGQPTSKHFQLRIYDDIITRESVTTPEMIKKVTEAWELSTNLGAEGGRVRYVGTHYHMADTYMVMRERAAVKVRLHPGTDDGEPTGAPVLFTTEYMEEKRRMMGTYIFACQILLNPKADSALGFKEEWLQFWPAMQHDNLNKYILVDPASSKKKKENDYTVMGVIGLGPDRNYYLIDMIRDRLNLTEKARRLIHLHQQYQPLAVGYEQYGLQADIEYLQLVQKEINYRFKITELGGQTSKNDRIAAFLPIVEAERFYVPERLVRQNYLGHQEDLTQVFIREELVPWPYGLHDDILDMIARIQDGAMGAVFPQAVPNLPDGYDERQNEWDPVRDYLR